MSRILVILLMLIMGSPSAFAFRCNGQLVVEGDSTYEVLRKCGDPRDKQMVQEVVPLYNAAFYPIGQTVRIYEIWTYQQSRADFRHELIIENGRVREIRSMRSF